MHWNGMTLKREFVSVQDMIAFNLLTYVWKAVVALSLAKRLSKGMFPRQLPLWFGYRREIVRK